MSVRVRFAPSPTGPLHIGGARTALFNYLFARHHGGTFLLRVEDTDQLRYVEGAEEYIRESLSWLGLEPAEGPVAGGPHAPYRQSERKEIYQAHAQQLVEAGKAYLAFDTPEELEHMRAEHEAAGDTAQKYDATVRMRMRNSLTLGEDATQALLDKETPFTVRLLVPQDEQITFHDKIRGEVTFSSNELDDKVLIKADGLPTYHLANVVDDQLMEITHVIRGEEWLSSTAHHVLLYRAFGWEKTMPEFAHLPLILKPSGQGKLSKRDGAKFGFPVFPLDWKDPSGEFFDGFREAGFLPEALVNFLALLGWNPGDDQEIFDLNGLATAFSLENVSKGGARFDYDKAVWFNQQYILALNPNELARRALPFFEKASITTEESYLVKVCAAYRERIKLLRDLPIETQYLFGDIQTYDTSTASKKWQPDLGPHFEAIAKLCQDIGEFSEEPLKEQITAYIKEHSIKMGVILPLTRIAISGSPSGPEVFLMLELLGREKVVERMKGAAGVFEGMH